MKMLIPGCTAKKSGRTGKYWRPPTLRCPLYIRGLQANERIQPKGKQNWWAKQVLFLAEPSMIPTSRQSGSMSEWLKEADCKSASYAYVGSNPARPISRLRTRISTRHPGQYVFPAKVNLCLFCYVATYIK